MSMQHSLIDVDMDSNSAGSQLQFQDFAVTNSAAQLKINSTETLNFNNVPDTARSENDGVSVGENDGRKSASFWSFEFYQDLFDVNTDQVVNRIKWSMIPYPGSSFLIHHIKPKPDMYGPLWICITLVFSIAISGNLVNYIQTAGQDVAWKYDFHVVTYAATAIFSYTWLVPIILWGLLKWQRESYENISFLELLCLYGYSLAIYVPVSFLCLIPINGLQWLFIGIGATLSGSVLLITLWPALQGERRCLLVIGILILHILLAVGCMFAFFHVSTKTASVSHISSEKSMNIITNAKSNNISES